jgi:hypothetical protein
MDGKTLAILAGVAIGWFRAKSKRKRLVAAALGAGAGWLFAAQIAPRIGLVLPGLPSRS